MININLKPGAKRQAPEGRGPRGRRCACSPAIGKRHRAARPGLAGGDLGSPCSFRWSAYLHTGSQLACALDPQVQPAQDEYQRYHELRHQKEHEAVIRD